ncbi:MAG: filamentous hemagglutinin N-terminal domain-containing protein [Azonexus sp.]|nr:filamentous hemagglutinin N-terminal domain-containing protein [Azonexus sp.]
MNHGIYRLVFNSERNSWVAVAENVRGRGKKSTRRRVAAAVLGLAALAAISELAWAAPPAVNALPVPSSGARPFVFSGAVTGGQPSTVGNAMTINTASRTLGLNWQSFNVGSSASVTFNQPDSTSRVLNRIWSNDPSQIMGKLNANGQIYLINQNGILFGNGAQVNVGGLVASAINLSDAMASKLLNNGLPSARGDSLEFAFDGSVAGFNSGFVTVEAGAAIRTPSGGRVVLIAPKTVENMGLIEGGGGAEAILAAGGKVILTAPDDPALRGLLVETKSFTGRDGLGNSVTLDGTVTNKSDGTANNGRIDTGAGGIVSLAALAVNQKGIVNATKAVNLNGTTMLVSGTIETDRLTINQRGDKAEIDWVSGFNVGAGKTVEFVQSSAGAVAYNYVYEPDRIAADGTVLNVAGRSIIDGIVKASGQFVLVNEKGIDFNSNARVSASNFVASALGMNPAIVNSGLLGQTDVAKRAFYLSKTPLTYSDADPDKQQVFDQALGAFRQATIDVKSGARITSGTNGYVILTGSKVKQSGNISSPGGQTVLAAGADLYLKPGYSSAVRGFTAEVNPLYVVRTKILNDLGNEVADTIKPWLVLSRGVDANSVTNNGSIASAFGDITLVGHEIMQAGTLLASTSVSANGSIHMLARDQLNIQGDGEPTVPSVFWRKYGNQGLVASTGTPVASTEDDITEFIAGRVGGKLTLAAGSQTVVEIDGSDGKKLTADQTFTKSSIDAMARQIIVADADIKAQGGNIRLRASEEFSEFSASAADAPIPSKTSTPPAGVGIFVADGARIDASGTNASKSAADLFIEVELRGDEFADNPVQRDGKLRGEKAWVDIRDKVSIANLDGWTRQVGQTVNEKAASGGEISLGTTGSVIVKAGAELDVSGGKVDYAAASVSESRAMTLGGQRYRLNDAPASSVYAGLITTQRQEAAYVEGKSAGKVEVVGNSLALDGQLLAKTTVGTRQREIGDATNRFAVPYGGQLIITDAGQHMPLANAATATEEEKIAAFKQAQIAFVQGAASAAAGLSEDSSAGPRLELSQSLVKNGFSRFDITSDGRIEIPAEVSLNLAPGGSFAASGRQIYVAGDISAPGGSIALKTRDMSTSPGDFPGYTEARFSTLTLASGAELSTAGRWVNDYIDGSFSRVAKAINGGSVNLTSVYDLDLQKGSVIDVSGGAWVNQKGSLKSGNAGSIALATGVTVSKEGNEKGAFNFTEDGDRRDASAFLDGTLSGYALGKGGTLSINTSAIRFGQTFSADSRDWSRAKRLAESQVGAAFDAGFVDRGGFFAFNFVGRDGVVVADSVHLSPDPVSWSLARVSNYRYRTTGSALADFAQAVVLHPDLRSAPTSLSLATRSLAYGDLLIGENAYLGVSPKGSINLSSRGQLTVLGTLEALAGTISLSRPANRTDEPYNNFPIIESEEKQSESIYLGSNSRLLAGGTTMLSAATRLALEAGVSASQLRSQSRYKGALLDGGTVSIDAGLGYLVSRSGSQIDVSGKTDILNLPSSTGFGLAYPALTVGSAGGTVSLAARDGMFLDGSYKAVGGSNALGGIFSLRFADLGNNDNPWGIVIPQSGNLSPDQLAMMAARQLTIYQSASSHADLWPSDVNSSQYLAGNAVIDAETHNGKAALDVASLVSGGFGSWYLKSQDEMRFSGAISATVNNQLNLNAPKFSAVNDATQLVLKAAAVQIGNSKSNVGAAAVAADIGGATAKITGLDVGLGGTFSWNGFGESKFVSLGEIHFDSVQNNVANPASGRTYNGQMTASGDLEFSAARLSPATYSDFRIDLQADPNSSIKISRPPGASADVSLSAGGRLEFVANSITHDGAISAPLGEIVFNAPGGKVTLGAGSFTSVAADRDLLFGNTTESASAWKYQGQTIDAMPGKSIRIDAADTVVASGAKLDLSGGGDALAWEFTAGPGGKNDVLAASTQTFALVPGWKGFSATDGELQQGYLKSADGSIASLKVGDRISLAANPTGLDGSYVLLPARYAILAGAYLVTVKESSDNVVRAAQKQPDGSWLVAGSRFAANADGSTTPYSSSKLTLELASSAVVAQRANYTQTSASQFFFDQSGANLAGDAGRLTAVGRDSLVFDPVITAMRVAEIAASDGRTRAGRGMELDLAAPRLLVSDSASTKDASWSWLDQNKLNGLGASSLLLGGARTNEGDRTRIETVATELLVSNNSSALSAEELMLTANENLTVDSNSTIDTKGAAEARTIVLSGDGAFLRAAEGPQAAVSRDGNVSRTQGDLIIQSGAKVAAQSLVFDATRANTLDGLILPGVRQSDGSRGSGGAVNIGAGRINVVADGNSSQPTDGLTLGNADLTRFATVDQLRLTSYSTLDLYGDAVLGSSSLKELVIAAAGIAGHGNDGSSVATITAKKVAFTNPNPELDGYIAGAGLGEGALKVKATTIEFGGNSTSEKRAAKTEGFGIRGFDKVDLVATGDVLFSGVGVTAIDNVGGSGKAAALTIDAGRVATVGTANHLLVASGKSEIKGGNAGGTTLGLGGSLEIEAKAIDVSGRIETPAGKLTLAATGSAAGDHVTIQKDAIVAAEGTRVAFADTFAYAPGGQITLSAASGNVAIDSGAVVSVAAHADGGDAGKLILVAKQGTVSAAAGSLRGDAAKGGKTEFVQGRLTVDALNVALDGLADAVRQTLPDASTRTHFGGEWDIRARSGNLDLSKSIATESAIIAADNGSITVGSTGVIDASGSKGGKIGLYSRSGDVVLAGQLLAKGNEVVSNPSNAGTRGQGGEVELSASAAGKVKTLTGSLIDVGVADGSAAAGGKVNFRADESASIASKSSLNIQLAGKVLGASDVGVEIVKKYSGTSLKTGTTSGQAIGLATINSDLNGLFSASNMNLLRSHLGFDSALQHVRAGAEITSTSTGDFIIANDLDFSALRFQGEAGVLTLKAQGNLKINSSISDGFNQVKTSPASYLATGRDARISSSDASWSYRLLAGADTSAARTTAVKAPAATGNIEIASGKLVRTGTGDITLAAQGDIKLLDKAVVYTAGRNDTATPANFVAAPGPNDTSDTGQRNYFLRNGGDLNVTAGGNISQVSAGALTDWMVTYSKGYNSTQWWARLASLQQGFAAFGGGDINLAAGGNLSKVSAVIPTNGRVPGLNDEAQPELAVINAGGNLSVKTDGSINGGLFYAETGRLNMTAGKSITQNPVLAMGNTTTRVTAAETVSLGNIQNPMSTSRNSGLLKNSSGGALAGTMATAAEYRVRIGTYGEDSRLDVTSVNGDLKLETDVTPANGVAPNQVSAVALNGSITANLLQMPGASGQLDLLAANNLEIKTITQFDMPANLLPGIASPIASGAATDPFPKAGSRVALPASLAHSSVLWHADDFEPSRLIALTGNIVGEKSTSPTVKFNEAVTVQAGNDIKNLNISVQHAHGSDVSRISAGGDIRYENYNSTDPNDPSGKKLVTDASSPLGIRVSGPGGVEVVANKTIDLADTKGIVSSGNLDNPYLPEGGASILAVAGATPDYESLRTYLGLPKEVSNVELRQTFFTMLRDYGREAQFGGGQANYDKGSALAQAFFPPASVGKGDIKLSVSQIKTEQGGSIQAFAPGGSIQVGVADPSMTKKASSQGMFTIRDGDIQAYVANNFLVNQSRVFTLDGGDVMIWADKGSIDAGSGSKTQNATPPPVLVIRDGQIVLDTSNSVSGSGIGVLASRDDTPASDMDLFAPKGAIDAGDAGLRSTGNITLGARTILNASNIQAGGGVTGAPAPTTTAAPVAAMAPPTSKEDRMLEESPSAAGNRNSAQGMLTVEVLGGDDCTDSPRNKACNPG